MAEYKVVMGADIQNCPLKSLDTNHYREDGSCLCVEQPDKPWRVEVTTSDSPGKWYTNALRFEEEGKAREYAGDLARRWTLVTRWRTVDDSVPLDQPYETGSEDGTWL